MSERRDMAVTDWLDAFINLVIGILLGMAAASLVQLATTDFWPLAIVIPILFAGVFLFIRVFDGLFERIFSIGVRPARKPRPEGKKPLVLLFSLPAGLVLGVILERIGLSGTILDLL